MTNKWLLLIAVLLGAVAVVSVDQYVRQKLKGVTQRETVLQVVKAVPRGGRINKDAVRTVEIESRETALLASLVRSSQLNDLARFPTARAMNPSDLVRWDDFAWTAQEDGAGLVRPGHVAVAIRSNSLMAFGGLVQPGDVVDVWVPGPLSSVSVDGAESAKPRGELSTDRFEPQRLLSGVTVLAVGQATRADLGPLGRRRGGLDFAAVTLEVLEEYAPKAIKLTMSGATAVLTMNGSGAGLPTIESADASRP